MIKVAQVIGKLNKGGVEAVINNYYRYIDRDKFQFDYYIDSDGSCEPSEEMKALGARYFVIPPYQKLPEYMKALEEHFAREKYDVVHVNMNTLSVFALKAAKDAGIPVRINHNHSTLGKGETKRNILKYSLRPFAKRYATDLAACNETCAGWLFGKNTLDKGKVKIIRNAIDLEKYAFDSSVRDKKRRELNIEKRTVIGHVGRFCTVKNHRFVLEIFAEYLKRDYNAVLLLIGDGPLMADTEARAESLGINRNVVFTGNRSDVPELYNAMDLVLLPSLYEGLPMVGVEAQANGLPVIMSDRVPREAKLSSSVSFLPLGDAKLWADAAEEAVRHSRYYTFEEMKRSGYDIKEEAKVLEDWYLQILK